MRTGAPVALTSTGGEAKKSDGVEPVKRKEVTKKSMAFLLSNIGLLGQMAAQGSHHKGSDPSAQLTNPYAPSFGSVLGGQMNALGSSAPLRQLTAVVQNGTPISTVVDRLAGLVAKQAGANAGSV